MGAGAVVPAVLTAIYPQVSISFKKVWYESYLSRKNCWFILTINNYITIIVFLKYYFYIRCYQSGFEHAPRNGTSHSTYSSTYFTIWWIIASITPALCTWHSVFYVAPSCAPRLLVGQI